MGISDVKSPKLPSCRDAENLGQGWKVALFTLTIMDVDGSTVNQHMWMGARKNPACAVGPGYIGLYMHGVGRTGTTGQATARNAHEKSAGPH